MVKISGSHLYIDAGKKSNLSKGTVLNIYQKGSPVTNLSGKVIGYEETWLGTGTISEFFGADGAIVELDSESGLSLPLFCRLAEKEELREKE